MANYIKLFYLSSLCVCQVGISSISDIVMNSEDVQKLLDDKNREMDMLKMEIIVKQRIVHRLEEESTKLKQISKNYIRNKEQNKHFHRLYFVSI